MDTIKIESKGVKLIAHRGLSGIERENTCAAFVAAGNRSYFGIETDIHTTKDGKFVVIHDETTTKVSQERYNIDVEKNDYAAVENLVLPDKDGTTVRKDIRIPLLKEYIKICKKYDKVCVLEIKNLFAESDLKRVVEEIKEEEYLENLIFISFVMENCKCLRKLFPEAEVQFLLNEKDVSSEILKTLCDYNLDLDINHVALDKEKVEMLHSKGIKVNCWTCDDKDRAEKLVEMGVDFITTNILE